MFLSRPTFYLMELFGRNFVYLLNPSSDTAGCKDTLQLLHSTQSYDHLWFIQTCEDTHRVLKPHDHFMFKLEHNSVDMTSFDQYRLISMQ